MTSGPLDREEKKEAAAASAETVVSACAPITGGESDKGTAQAGAQADEANTNENANGNANANANAQSYQPGRRNLLSDPLDEANLSPLLCYVRSQIEFFPATTEDAAARNSKGGIKKPVTEGRVGIRCVWCADLPDEEKANGAVKYPDCLRLIHQSVRNWQRHHLKACPSIPQDVRDELTTLASRRRHSNAPSNYWIESCQRKGMYDAERENEGIRLKGIDYSEVDKHAAAVDAAKSAACSKKKKSSPKKNKKKPSKDRSEELSELPAEAVLASDFDLPCHVPSATDGFVANAFLGGASLNGLNLAPPSFVGSDNLDGKEGGRCAYWPDSQNGSSCLNGLDLATSIIGSDKKLNGKECGKRAYLRDSQNGTSTASGADAVVSSNADGFCDGKKRIDQADAAANFLPRAELQASFEPIPIRASTSVEDDAWLGHALLQDVNLDEMSDDEPAYSTASASATPATGLVSTAQQDVEEKATSSVGALSHRASSALSADTDELFDGITNFDLDALELDDEDEAAITHRFGVDVGAKDADPMEPIPLNSARRHSLPPVSGIRPYEHDPFQQANDSICFVEPDAAEAQMAAPTKSDATRKGSKPALLHTGSDTLVTLGRNAKNSANSAVVPETVSSSNHTAAESASLGDGVRNEHEKLAQKIHLAYSIVQAADMIIPLPKDHSDPAVSADTAECQVRPEVQNDLFSLGVELYELFAEVRPFRNSFDGNDDSISSETGGNIKQKRERKSTAGNYTPLRELGFPVLLCNVVSSLLGEDGDSGTSKSSLRSYQSFNQVKEDLRLMTTDPDRYLYDSVDVVGQSRSYGNDRSGKITLQFPDSLYGRQEHFHCLMETYDRVIQSGGACEVLLVAGYSGTGKSTLVKQVQGPLAKNGGYFISGKFNEMMQIQPMSAIVSAFNEFCDTLMGGDATILDEIRTAIKEAVGTNGKVLTDLIPNLVKVIGMPDPNQSVVVQGTKSLNRLKFLFRQFLRAICSMGHPIILFIDDLQWADEASLELITSLVTDTETKSLLFLGCYRDNEVSEQHVLMTQLRSIEQSGVGVTTINVNNMQRDAVNELVSDTLRLSPHQTSSLSDLVYRKTSGNPLFVVGFLRALNDEGLLNFSLRSHRWEWDMGAILSKKVADNVVDLMMGNMLRLPPDVLWTLKLASCLGCQCEESVLSLIDAHGASQLDVAVREGLMFKVGTTYKFSHDQIQHAAYSLIQTGQQGEQAAMHLQIGRILMKKALPDSLDNVLFVMVEQLHSGSSLIVDREEKNEVAKLYLLAGKKAISSSAFLPASIYLQQGIALLDDSHWSTHYNLALELFSHYAEAQYVTGNLGMVEALTSSVFQRGRSLHDKLPAYFTLVPSLDVQGKAVDAVKCILDVLAELGESFPDQPSKECAKAEFAKTRSMLEDTTINGILQSVDMHDANTIAILRFLIALVRILYPLSKNELMSLAICRMVQLSLSHGIRKECAYAFSAFGVLCCNYDYGLADRYGKLAFSILDRTKDKESLARLSLSAYGFVFVLTQPLQSSLPPLKHAFEVGMSMGDVEAALNCIKSYIVIGFYSGRNLKLLTDEAKSYLAQMKEHNHEMTRALTAVHLQAGLNLMGRSDEVTVLTGEAMNQEALMAFGVESKASAIEMAICLLQMILAYLFERYDLAAEAAERRRVLSKERPMRNATISAETFYMGLIAVEMARKERLAEESVWKAIAYEAKEQMEELVEMSSWNCQHKLDLLNAELAYLNGDWDEAAKKYDEAIRVAEEHRFVHEKAISCERAAIFHSQVSNSHIANYYFLKAHGGYLEWGAQCKADHLHQQHVIT